MHQVQLRVALVGAWRLVSRENHAADGQVTYPMGTDATGYLIKTADGYCSVMISRAIAPRSPATICRSGTAEEGPGQVDHLGSGLVTVEDCPWE
jgi:hypothetical protein